MYNDSIWPKIIIILEIPQEMGGGSPYGQISTNRTSKYQVTGIVVNGVTDQFKHGAVTRPKNMHVSFIMRVW